VQPSVARIDEALCVGCARCLPACPVDAIIGSRNFTHTIVHNECVGCGLCLAPCPTCGAGLTVASVIEKLIAHSREVVPSHVPGLVLEYEDPHAAGERMWREFESRIATSANRGRDHEPKT